MLFCYQILTFNLPNKFYYSSNVKGNGINLGITSNGTNMAGLSWDNSIGLTIGRSNIILPANAGNSGLSITSGYGLGITTDPTKSGIVVEPDTDIKLIIKY